MELKYTAFTECPDYVSEFMNYEYDERKTLFTVRIRCGCGITSNQEFTLDFIEEVKDNDAVLIELDQCKHSTWLRSYSIRYMLFLASIKHQGGLYV